MNIWMLNHYAITPDMPGGTRHYCLGRELVMRGYDVTIFAASFNYSTRREEKLKKGERFREEDVQGVRFIWIKSFPYLRNNWRRVVNWVTYAVRVIHIGSKMKERPDVIIGSSVHLFTPLSGYILARLKKSRFFFEVRDLWPQTLIDIGSINRNHPFIILLRLLERFLYKKAERIITLLPKAGDYIKKCGIPEGKIAYLPNGVDIEAFPEQKWPKTNGLAITYLGTHGSANALDAIIEAAGILESEGLNDIQFQFIGDGPLKQYLIDKIKTQGLRNIRFYNPLPKKDLYTVARDTHAFIVNMKDIPLYRYGISFNKIYDYMAMARPVIIGCSAGNNPIKEASAGISVDADSPLQMAEAVRKLRGYSKVRFLSMGNNGRAFVKRNNKYSVLSNNLEKWLKESLPYLGKE